jgi:glycosyltransferase involved in cell wall biosynthesis
MISVVIISKDETGLDETLADIIHQAGSLDEPAEIVIVDASGGRLDHIRTRYEADIQWLQFKQPPGVSVSIPQQRNAGVREAHGDVIVFTDAGCRPENGWLARLVTPLRQQENVTAGLTLATPGSSDLYDRSARQALTMPYLNECATINIGFRRSVFDTVGGFDERFAYGSDVDFTWRICDAGYRIRSVPDAVVRHDWGGWRRQLRRSYVYGQARGRLYRKHRSRRRQVLRNDPVMIVYPVFLLGLPLTLIFPLYPALLLVPAWHNRADGAVRVVANHLSYGAGVLAELAVR